MSNVGAYIERLSRIFDSENLDLKELEQQAGIKESCAQARQREYCTLITYSMLLTTLK